VKRRDFITLLGGAAAWPLAARAQQPRMTRIGVLLVESPEPLGPFREAFRDLGYVEGRNVQIDVVSAHGQLSVSPPKPRAPSISGGRVRTARATSPDRTPHLRRHLTRRASAERARCVRIRPAPPG
jgi:hypothetical protein